MERQGDWDGRVKQRGGGGRGIREGMRTTNTKGYLKGHMETYDSKSFLEHIHIRKKSERSHQITEETKPQLDTIHHQVKSPLPGMGDSWLRLSCCPKGLYLTPQTTHTIAKAIGNTFRTKLCNELPNVEATQGQVYSGLPLWPS